MASAAPRDFVTPCGAFISFREARSIPGEYSQFHGEYSQFHREIPHYRRARLPIPHATRGTPDGVPRVLLCTPPAIYRTDRYAFTQPCP